MTLEKKQEFTLKITQANKTQLITILYEMVMDYLDETIDAFAVGAKGDAEKSIRNAQNCIDELIHSLNMEYELARVLHKIYIFSKTELTGAFATGNSHRVWKVKKNFEMLHEAYVELEKMDMSESLMDNTQKVYAGLTYGRYALNESITAVSMNRGLMA